MIQTSSAVGEMESNSHSRKVGSGPTKIPLRFSGMKKHPNSHYVKLPIRQVARGTPYIPFRVYIGGIPTLLATGNGSQTKRIVAKEL